MAAGDGADGEELERLDVVCGQLRAVLSASRPLAPAHLGRPVGAAAAGHDLADLHHRVGGWLTAVRTAAETLRSAAEAEVAGSLATLRAHGLLVGAGTPESERQQLLATLTAVAALDDLDGLGAPPSVDDDAAGADAWLGALLGRAAALLPPWLVVAPRLTVELPAAPDPQPSTDDVADWWRDLALVRPQLGAFDTALLTAEVVGHGAPADLGVVQQPGPDGSSGPWLATAPAPDRPLTRSALVLERSAGAGTVRGLLVDAWTEVVPRSPAEHGPEEVVGVAFDYDRPGARAPQALLVAVPPDPARGWCVEDLHGCVEDTLALARVRSLILADVPELSPAAADPAGGAVVSIEVPGRGRGIEEGLAARVQDPLWFLARQWQFGEFRHENAASPAWVETTVEAHRLDQWRPADEAGWQPYDLAAVPLERMVEEHQGGPTPRLRLEGGRRWLRAMEAAGKKGDAQAFVAHCRFVDDPLMARELVLLRARVPDGASLAGILERLVDPGTQAAVIADLGDAGLASADDVLTGLATTWLAWWSARAPRVIPADEDCWDDHRLEHRFALRATTLPEVELAATEYAGGRLDWSAVDAVQPPGDPGAPGQALSVTRTGVPAPARFGGMPAARFWEMEDARFDPGSVDAAPIDLGRLMLVSYATVYGNDWFVVPVSLPAGSLSRVTDLQVRDVFGDSTTLTGVAADVDGWNLFGLTRADQPLEPLQERPTSPWFFLAPSLPASLESQPTDTVFLLRDEMANLAWAVEAVVADDTGRPRDRFAEWAAREQAEPVASDVPLYRVATDVPDHWFPLVPERDGADDAIRLRLVTLSRIRDGRLAALEPTGTLLPAEDRWLHEEEVPRSGVQVDRTWQYARWHDGSRHVWQARRRRTGRGEGDSGLRFDQVESAR